MFKEPLPGSTNYLTAYDESGKLLRMKDQLKSSESSNDEDEDDGRERPMKKVADLGPIPPETAEDLMPFPQNRQFRSQAVLSEELKDEIWRQVVDSKKSVRTVSVDLSIDMNRVGAVVRLKAIEKQWVEKVRLVLLSFTIRLMAFT